MDGWMGAREKASKDVFDEGRTPVGKKKDISTYLSNLLLYREDVRI
jgi:hypothetical protein